MSYDWKKAAEQEAPESEPLPAGEHVVRVERVIFGYRDGEAFSSRSDDPQIMLVFADGDGREAANMYTLSPRAAWTLAKVLHAAGADVAAMTAKGVEPGRFAEPRFAEAQLVGRELRIEVRYEVRDGREYAKVMPVKGGRDEGMGSQSRTVNTSRQVSGDDMDRALSQPAEQRRQVGVAAGVGGSSADGEVDDIPF